MGSRGPSPQQHGPRSQLLICVHRVSSVLHLKWKRGMGLTVSPSHTGGKSYLTQTGANLPCLFGDYARRNMITAPWPQVITRNVTYTHSCFGEVRWRNKKIWRPLWGAANEKWRQEWKGPLPSGAWERRASGQNLRWRQVSVHQVILMSLALCKKWYHSLTGMARLVGHRPAKRKVNGSIPSRGMCLGCRFGQSGTWEATDWCFSLSSMSLTLSFSLPSPFSKNKYIKSFLFKSDITIFISSQYSQYTRNYTLHSYLNTCWNSVDVNFKMHVCWVMVDKELLKILSGMSYRKN